MTVHALLLGSLGVVVETSDMQRRAFNAAFETVGLDWRWDRETYGALLKSPGGEKRVAAYADAQGVDVDAAAVHAEKVRQYDTLMRHEGLSLRAGVRDLIDAAHAREIAVGWVTDTGTDQIDAVFEHLGGAIERHDFKFIGADFPVIDRKPAPEIYEKALSHLNVAAKDALAVEDTAVCAKAAVAAGIRTIGFPNAFAQDDKFDDAVQIVDALTPALLGE